MTRFLPGDPWSGREGVVETGWPEIVVTLLIALLIVVWMLVGAS